MTPLVTTICNQCDRNNHLGCPAEKLFNIGFMKNPGEHCACANEGHKSKQTTKEFPKFKSMLERQKKERDVPVDRNVVEVDEIED